MTQDNLARDLSGSPDEAVYEALVAALRSSARGRAFLDEFARRARAEDTAAALAALERIEGLLTRERAAAVERETESAESDPSPAPLRVSLRSPGVGHPLPQGEREETSRPSGADLLAQVMALSPEERIALFS